MVSEGTALPGVGRQLAEPQLHFFNRTRMGRPEAYFTSYRSVVSPVTVVLRQFLQKQTGATVEIPTDVVYETANDLLSRHPTLQTQKITFSVVAVYENGESKPGRQLRYFKCNSLQKALYVSS